MTDRPAKKSRYYPLLDGIRGLAAIAVMFRHMGDFGIVSPAQSYLAVDMFFMLSGVVIANAYDRRLTTDMSFGDFLRRRLIRLYPMIVLGVALGVLNVFFGSTDADTKAHVWLAAVVALVLMPNNPLLSLGDLDGPGWSLSYELAANVVYARAIRKLTMPRLIVLCLGAALLVTVAAIYKGHLDTGNSLKSIPFGIGRVGFSFFAGIILYRLHRAGALSIPAALQGALGLLAVVALMGATLLTTPPPWARAACALASLFILIPAIIVLGMEIEKAPARACDFLGKVSYPLYLMHAPLAFLCVGILTRHGLHDRLGIAALIFAPTVVVLAWVAERVFDAPVRNALMRWKGFRRARTQAA